MWEIARKGKIQQEWLGEGATGLSDPAGKKPLALV